MIRCKVIGNCLLLFLFLFSFRRCVGAPSFAKPFEYAKCLQHNAEHVASYRGAVLCLAAIKLLMSSSKNSINQFKRVAKHWRRRHRQPLAVKALPCIQLNIRSWKSPPLALCVDVCFVPDLSVSINPQLYRATALKLPETPRLPAA